MLFHDKPSQVTPKIDGTRCSKTVIFEYIDYIKPGENHYSWLWMGLVFSLFSFVGSYYYVLCIPPY